MAVKQIIPGLHVIPCGAVNTFLLDWGTQGLALIDTGFPDQTAKVLDGIRGLGRRPEEVRHIVLTHAHVDHVGGLADLVRATGAETWMHDTDASLTESGAAARPLNPAPELLPRLLFKIFIKPGQRAAPARIDHRVLDGDVLPVAGGLRAIHVPGHCAGQIALLWESRKVLFVGDACINLLGRLNSPLGYEDEAEGRRSQKKLGTFNYTVACFGHGSTITADAAAKMRAKWGA